MSLTNDSTAVWSEVPMSQTIVSIDCYHGLVIRLYLLVLVVVDYLLDIMVSTASTGLSHGHGATGYAEYAYLIIYAYGPGHLLEVELEV